MSSFVRALQFVIPLALMQSACEPQTNHGGVAGTSQSLPTAHRSSAHKPTDNLAPDSWEAGTHYVLLTPPQPTSTTEGQVEVIEFFWYGCSHCNDLEAYLATWQKRECVAFRREHVLWKAAHRAHARLYYALESLGCKDLHPKVFETIHQRGNRLFVQDEEDETFKSQLRFAKAHGIGAQEFRKAYNSSRVNSSLQRAEANTRRYRIEGVPTIVVNGKYLTDAGRAGGYASLFRLVNDLAAVEKSRTPVSSRDAGR